MRRIGFGICVGRYRVEVAASDNLAARCRVQRTRCAQADGIPGDQQPAVAEQIKADHLVADGQPRPGKRIGHPQPGGSDLQP